MAVSRLVRRPGDAGLPPWEGKGRGVQNVTAPAALLATGAGVAR
ncbi:hypothetical protein HMPREF0731_2247 [Pseudoroseomonas cervicalis ATCC 49957]|uniref:Uncharacterized protein n=1 Tax=Pseudoroseomonas cervicalis ATCC 49957 TaxID=525371 RepID=D5RMD6_9PROT|nr:hypothetical protein HMPREF0731_2247 [Pseudoroseomonas cervicalis ATCC 49957]